MSGRNRSDTICCGHAIKDSIVEGCLHSLKGIHPFKFRKCSERIIWNLEIDLTNEMKIKDFKGINDTLEKKNVRELALSETTILSSWNMM